MVLPAGSGRECVVYLTVVTRAMLVEGVRRRAFRGNHCCYFSGPNDEIGQYVQTACPCSLLAGTGPK
jgi:hypothetical protein